MNQILSTNTNNNNYNKTDIKKIIVFFCIAIVIISIIIISMKIYGLYSKNNAKYAIPEIETIKTDDTSKEVTIKVACSDGIDYLIYTWNNEDENRVNLNGSPTFERMVRLPENAINNLKINVVSSKGVTNENTEIIETSAYSVKPTIDSVTIVDSKLHIQASDDDGIKYLAYKWENEDEVIIPADEINNKTIEKEIDIQRGTYKLLIRVVDIYENEESLSRLITGVNEPEINVIKYDNTVRVTVIHDMGFKKIEFIINNDVYVYDENYAQYDANRTTVEYNFPLKNGENIIQVNAYSQERLSDEQNDDLENFAFKTYTGKCTYEQ